MFIKSLLKQAVDKSTIFAVTATAGAFGRVMYQVGYSLIKVSPIIRDDLKEKLRLRKVERDACINDPII